MKEISKEKIEKTWNEIENFLGSIQGSMHTIRFSQGCIENDGITIDDVAEITDRIKHGLDKIIKSNFENNG